MIGPLKSLWEPDKSYRQANERSRKEHIGMEKRQARDGTLHDPPKLPLHTDDVIPILLPGVCIRDPCVCTSVNSLYASPRQQYRDYVIGVKREFRRVSQSAKS